MNTILILVTAAFALAIQPSLAAPSLKASQSPVLSTNESDGGLKGALIPNSYGGVTAVLLDIDQVGTDQMLKARFFNGPKFFPMLGKHFVLHSDKTVENAKKGTKERTVILIDSTSLQKFGRKTIICYKVLHNTKLVSNKGIALRSQETHYSLTFTGMKDDYEVTYFIPFRASHLNSEHPHQSEPLQKK